jgi:maleylpyruvate isomerase
MYPSVEARSEGIDEGARQSAAVLRGEAAEASARLQAAARAMPDEAWDGEIRTALGRQTTGAEVPWMRVRENWVHAVDLDAGGTVADFPAQVVVDLLTEVKEFVSARDGCPSMILDATDTGERWMIGPPGDATTLTGTQQALLAWLIGRRRGERIDSSAGDVPEAPRWL